MVVTRERLIRYLDDAWTIEKVQADSLDRLIEGMNDPELQTIAQEHLVVTSYQKERLDTRLRTLGEAPLGGEGPLPLIACLMNAGLQAAPDAYDRNLRILLTSYTIDSFECAMYESLAAYASAIGDMETAGLARMHLLQERQSADMLWSHLATTAARATSAVIA
jgi:ferritin-like metal-binding protein YciE